MDRISQEFKKPLNEVERKWIRRPVAIVLAIPLFVYAAIYGATVIGCATVYDFLEEHW